MSKTFKKDLTGQRFGRLTVLEFVPRKGRHSYWLCRCDCGNEKVICGESLLKGTTTSCSCKQREIVRTRSVTHGLTDTRLYNSWCSMKARCYNHKNKEYNRYGGRGITICAEWKNNFKTFYDWAMANGYSDDLSIDRIDVNGNYEPANCCWATDMEQAGNRRSNVYVEYQGELMCFAEAARRSGLNQGTLKDRYYRNDRGERLFRPVDKKYHHKNRRQD